MSAVSTAAEECVKEGLTLTKRLHKEIGDSGIDIAISKRLKAMAAEANKLLVRLRRQMAQDQVGVITREQILRQALKDELIDRDANAARVAERQRLQAEKGLGIAMMAQRSEDAIAQINSSIDSLCPYQIGVSTSVAMLAEAADAEADAEADATRDEH